MVQNVNDERFERKKEEIESTGTGDGTVKTGLFWMRLGGDLEEATRNNVGFLGLNELG